MRIEELPGWLENEVDAFLGEVYHVSEDDYQALDSISLQVKELLWIGLYQLEEECHPGLERVTQALLYKVVINSVSPGD